MKIRYPIAGIIILLIATTIWEHIMGPELYKAVGEPITFILEAQSPAIPRLKRSRCRSSQEVNDSPTPFSALNYCLPALPIASMSLS